ncbi:MAG: tail fiber domain-containing protein [Candidatus Omnitrophica bacterium]|nr:tail fiber domain-containing protein [Candidatus Omnitrophota bacterium]MDD5027309.1 tail fiber domain-containing protein [Candidatus Omnitrophota bacterium]MDD5661949.1 tail fiber domain-containing protein [Candidatus Omnitrophota bacterium]
MLSSKKFYTFSVTLLLFFISPCILLAEDTLTITTYYPSPYGVYREMRAKRLAIGDNYIDNSNYTWEESDGDGGEIDYLADLVVEGNVGIGTTNPYSRVDVLTTTGNKYITFRADNAEQRFKFYVGASGNNPVLTMYQDDGTTEGVVLASVGNSYFNGGNVGIGTTAPSSRLTVQSSGGSTYPIKFLNSSGYRMVEVHQYDTGEGLLALRDGSSTEVCNVYLRGNGTAAKLGGGSWSDTSDLRLKKNISDLSGALQAILSLRPVSYEWINPEEHAAGVHAGLIAQEVKEVFPQWVTKNAPKGPDNNLIPKGEQAYELYYPSDFNAYLIGAIKEQQSQIDGLKKKVAILEAKLNPEEKI